MINNSKCSLKGCNRPVKIFKHGLCTAHLLRYYRHGDPGIAKIGTKKQRPSYKELTNEKETSHRDVPSAAKT